MAHNLNYRMGEASFFTVREKAWHKLGRVLDNPPTSEEAIIAANLDFTVEKRPNHIILNEDLRLRVPNSYTTIRTDTNTILGHNLTNKYHVVQNTDAFKVFDDIVGSKLAMFETAGALGDGETIFITAKLPNYMKMPNGDDIVEKYLLLSNSHDGSSSLTIMLTPIRVVCNNTLTLALSGRNNHKISLQHNSLISNKLNDAASLLGLINLNYDKMEEKLNHFNNIKLDDKTAKRLIAQLLLNDKDYRIEQERLLFDESISSKAKNTYNIAMEALYSGHGQNMYGGTGLWFFNGMSYYFQNVKNYSSEDKMMDGIFYGTSMNKMLEVSNLITTI